MLISTKKMFHNLEDIVNDFSRSNWESYLTKFHGFRKIWEFISFLHFCSVSVTKAKNTKYAQLAFFLLKHSENHPLYKKKLKKNFKIL